MKIIRFLFASFISIIIFIALNFKWGSAPPVGHFINPFQGFWQNAETNQPSFDKTILSEKVKDVVEVVYDQRLVPHIFATNDYDLYFAQGFVTAQNRLWQMEIQTMFASGRLSEILGNEMLEVDREMRRQGMVFGAENALKAAMSDSTAKLMLSAYSDGFNHYLHTLSYKSYPLEYKLLDYAPEEWTPLKTCLLLKYMAKNLAGYDHDLEMTNARRVFDKETFELLYSDNKSAAPDPIIPEGTRWDFQPVAIADVSEADTSFLISKSVPHLTQPSPDNGSNNWVVSGKKSRSGNPILANDPHLDLNLPSLWYEIQLTGKDINVYGATLPGAPGIIIGFNDSIAWGVTNAERYVMDWYKVDLVDLKKGKYQFNNQLKDAKKVIEEIKIRGQQTFYDTVYYTHFGPVVYDHNFFQKNEPSGYAMRWVAHDPSLEVLSFYKINRALNYNEFVDGLKHYSSPAQNFAFASASGDIAMFIAGKIPLKQKDQGRYLLDGNDPHNQWHGFIPFEHSPQVLNPSRGFVSSANQHPVARDYPYDLYEGTFEFYRNRRINKVLSEEEGLTVEGFMKLQNDSYNLMASEILPQMIGLLNTNNLNNHEQSYLNSLKDWNYLSSKDSEAATLYQIWFDSLYRIIWDEMSTDTLALLKPTKHTTVNLLKTNPSHFIFNIRETPASETASDLVEISFHEAVNVVEKIKKEQNLKKLSWGKYKATRIRHLFKPLTAFHSDTLVMGGNKGTVNALSSTHGPSWKMIVELGKEKKAYGIYPGGQSGNAGSPYYDNFIDTWAKGDYYELNFIQSPKEAQKNIFVQTIRANPKK